MPILLIIAASLLLFAVPGLLLAALLRPRGYPPLLSLGLAVAGWVVLFSNLAAVFDYRFPLFLAVQAALTVGLAVWAWRAQTLGALWRAARGAPGWAWACYGALAGFFILPAFVLPLPLDTDAQGFGYLALAVHLSGSITTLAPFHPEISYLYSPAYFLIIAFLRDLTGVPIHQAMLGFSHLAAFGMALAMFELGRETIDEAGGHFAALGVALGLGLFTTLMDAAYTNVFGLGLTATFLTLLFRAYRASPLADGRWQMAAGEQPGNQPHRPIPAYHLPIAAAVALAAHPLAHPDTIIHLLMAYFLFYPAMWLARPRPTRRQFVEVGLRIPIIGLLLTAPWVLRVLPLVPRVAVHEHLYASWSYYAALIQFHGPPILLLAALGLALAVRRRSAADVWMLAWLIPIVEFGFNGALDRWALSTGYDPFQIMYPFGIVWHALIVPLAYFAALALSAGVRTLAGTRLLAALARLRAPLGLAVLLLGLGMTLLHRPLLQATKGILTITGAYSSPADMQAMYWLKAHAPPDALILNFPDYESHWAPVLAERNAVYFRPQLFYIGDGPAHRQWADLEPAYLDPAAPDSAALLQQYGVDYVLVPQIVTRPDLFPQMLRWRFPDLPPLRSAFADASHLTLVADFDGARVYEVLEP